MHHPARSANGSHAPAKAAMIAPSVISNRVVTSPMMVAQRDLRVIAHHVLTATVHSAAMRHPAKSVSGSRAPAKAAMIVRSVISSQEATNLSAQDQLVIGPRPASLSLASPIRENQVAVVGDLQAASRALGAKQCA
jgi:hypothetical protein